MPHPQHDGTVADADGFCLRVLDDTVSGELLAAPCLLVATDACFLVEFAALGCSFPLTMMMEYDGAILQVVPSRQGYGVAPPTVRTPVAEFRLKRYSVRKFDVTKSSYG